MNGELKPRGAPGGNGSSRHNSPALSERNKSESRAPTRSVLRLWGSMASVRALPPNGPASLQPPASGKATKIIKANLSKNCIYAQRRLSNRVPNEFGERWEVIEMLGS